jgi:hypothetical protein
MPATLKRRWLVAWLRLHGLTFDAIGERVGITRLRAQQLYQSWARQGKNRDNAMSLPEQRDIIGYRDFVDGTRRPISEEASVQFIVGEDGERIYGTYLLADEGIIVSSGQFAG